MGKLRDTDGFTLLEVLIALVVLSMGLLGTLGMIASSIQGNAFSQQVSIATGLASDKIEELKNITYTPLSTLPLPVMGEKNVITGGTTNLADLTAVDNGGNTCPSEYPCGDILAGDGVWTYAFPVTVDNKGYNRIWTVEIDPNVNGVPLTSSVKLESVVSWMDGKGRLHKVRLGTILTK